MGRLIDADEIKKAFDPETWQGEMMIAIADTIPTAYDIEAVVKEVHEYFGKIMDERIAERDNVPIGEIDDIIKHNKAITGIIRKGGVK